MFLCGKSFWQFELFLLKALGIGKNLWERILILRKKGENEESCDSLRLKK